MALELTSSVPDRETSVMAFFGSSRFLAFEGVVTPTRSLDAGLLFFRGFFFVFRCTEKRISDIGHLRERFVREISDEEAKS